MQLTVDKGSAHCRLNREETLLQQGLNAGWPLARSCRNGNCERCFCQLLEGTVRYPDYSVYGPGSTIALCLAKPGSSLVLDSLPLQQRRRAWRCEITGDHTLQLPAGRVGKLERDCKLLLISSTHVLPATLLSRSGRSLTVNRPLTGEQPSIALVIIDGCGDGDWQLHHRERSPTLQWQGLDQDTAQQALALARKGSKHWFIQATSQ